MDWLEYLVLIFLKCKPRPHIGSLSNDDGDGNEHSKKAKEVYISKTTNLHVHHTFLYIS